MRGFFIAAAILPLVACMVETTPVADAEDTCGAAAMQGFVGQNESVLAATTFAAPVRFIHPKDAVTMDLRPDRLNFDIDDKGIIIRVRCG